MPAYLLIGPSHVLKSVLEGVRVIIVLLERLEADKIGLRIYRHASFTKTEGLHPR